MIFVTKLFLAREIKSSTPPSSLCLDLGVSVCSCNEMQHVPAVLALSSLARVSTRQSWIVEKDYTDNIVEAPCVIRLPATKVSFLLLSTPKPVSIVAGTLLEVEAKEPEVKKPFDKQARSSSTARFVASVSQSTSNTYWLSIIRDSVGFMASAFNSRRQIMKEDVFCKLS